MKGGINPGNIYSLWIWDSWIVNPVLGHGSVNVRYYFSDNISTANLYNNINSSIVFSAVWNELAYIISLEFSGNQGLFRALYFTTLLLKTMNFMLTIYSSELNSKNTNMLQFETFWIGIKHLERRKWKLILLIYIWFLYIFSFFEKSENDMCKESVNVEVLYFIWLIQHPWKMVRSLPICYVEQSGDMHVLDNESCTSKFVKLQQNLKRMLLLIS